MVQCITTLGPKSASDLGMILPHEHIFVDLRTGNPFGFAHADPADVIALMSPELDRASQLGVTLLVECTPLGVGRRADILKVVSEAAQFPLMVPTGIYREPWIPDWVHRASEDELYDWMLVELQDEIEGSGVQAGWIKLSANDEEMTVCETKILRAAARAGVATRATIGSHTIQGRVVREQLDVLEQVGYTADHFIWIHAQAEPNFDLNLEMARRGAWIEYDWIGNSDAFDDDFYIRRIQSLLDVGLGHRVLISHDRGWYDPARPNGGVAQPFTYITEHFIPKLLAAGVDKTTIDQLTCTNPFQAFAR
jgi:phosphotriesterase-related protein